ncbi:MAG: hypothetical protein KAQ96_01475 [Thermoplasmata archaeon]|nr:hypothetical protein [Thermoplasmata archaeon]
MAATTTMSTSPTTTTNMLEVDAGPSEPPLDPRISIVNDYFLEGAFLGAAPEDVDLALDPDR